jgi:hypothetical protein
MIKYIYQYINSLEGWVIKVKKENGTVENPNDCVICENEREAKEIVDRCNKKAA